jgi:hypothetical protein
MFRGNSFGDRSEKIVGAPSTNTVFFIRGDIGTVNDAKWAVDRVACRKGSPIRINLALCHR